MEAAALLRDLAAGRVPSLLLVHGGETLLVDELVERVSSAVLGSQPEGGLNREVLHADTASAEQVLAAGLGLALFGTRRLVLLRGLAGAPARTVERLRPAIEEARARPGGWPDPATTMVLVVAGADRRTPALSLVPEADRVEVRPPVGRAVVGWLRERAQGAGLDLLPEAAQTLVTLVGEDLARLAGELEKAALFVGDERRVTEEIVRALAGETRVRQYWELAQALEAGERAAALRTLEQLFRAGEDPLALLAQLTGYVRDLWRVFPARTGQPGASDAAQRLARRRPDWAVARLVTRARGLSEAGLRQAVSRCFEVERGLKSGAESPRALLTALVIDLAGPAPA